MKHRFARDLRVARRRSALTQADCAHLLGVNYSRISKLEAGKRLPSVIELSILMLILDQPLGNLTQDIVGSMARELKQRLSSIPAAPTTWPDRVTRLETLRGIAHKLSDVDGTDV